MNAEQAKRHNPFVWVLGLIALIVALGIGTTTQGAMPATASNLNSSSNVRLIETYGKLPMSFEPNQGQADGQVQFLSRGSGYTLFLTSTEAVLALFRPEARDTTVRMTLAGSNPKPQMAGLEALPGKVNYFLGKDPTKWRTNIPTYAKVKYAAVYPGIDLIYYGNQRQLEYDFVVAPGADPNAIRLAFAGADKLDMDAQGDLLVHTSSGDVRLHKLLVYQEVGGKRHEIDGRYVLYPEKDTDKPQVGFQVAAYDKDKPLVIDPVLVYSTYLGGSNSEALCGTTAGIALDTQGNVYVTGSTASLDFPTTVGAFDVTPNQFGNQNYTDAFVAKLNTEGSALIYATYLGGTGQASTCGTAIAVDKQGDAYVVGTTGAGVFYTDFPTTPGAFDTEFGPNSRIELNDGFVTKLNSTGSSLIYSTFLGGNWYDFPTSIAVDAQGNAFVTGWTSSGNFPSTPGAFDTTPPSSINQSKAFVVKLNPTGSALSYGTFLGGNSSTASISTNGSGIAIDDTGNAYVVGSTTTSDFPITPGAFDTNFNGSADVFVTKLNVTGTALLYSTYLGGSAFDSGSAIAVDSVGNAYVAGSTTSPDFPVTQGAFDTTFNGAIGHGFVTKLNMSGTALIYSTYLDGVTASGIAVDTQGNAYITGTGWTTSIVFPTTNPLQLTNAGSADAFVIKLNVDGSGLVYGTYLGGVNDDAGTGIAVDNAGNAYIVGITTSPDFPVTQGAFTTNYKGNTDAFIVKISNIFSVTAVTSSDFGNVTTGSSGNLEFIITNTSGTTLTITVTATAPFSVVSASTFDLAPGEEGPVQVSFNPTATGSFVGNVTFTTSNGTVFQQQVTGIGMPQTFSPIYGIPLEFQFTKDLQQGMTDISVRYLQIILNADPDTRIVSENQQGAQETCWNPNVIEGTPGCENQTFGPATYNAVVRFQLKHSISPAEGFVGPLTRGELGALLLKGIIVDCFV